MWHAPKNVPPYPLPPLNPLFLSYRLKPSEFGYLLIISSEFSAKRHIEHCVLRALHIFGKSPWLNCNPATQFWEVSMIYTKYYYRLDKNEEDGKMAIQNQAIYLCHKFAYDFKIKHPKLAKIYFHYNAPLLQLIMKYSWIAWP